MRIISWNIRAGGGVRAAKIAAQLERWDPSIVVLCEFRGTPPSRHLAARLREMGLSHQRTTALPDEPAKNALLVASRWPLRCVSDPAAPSEPCRFLSVRVDAPEPLWLGAMHVPNRSSGRKYLYHEAVLSMARRWADRPAVLVGDTNTGWPGLDEQVPCFGPREEAFMASLEALGWADVFRRVRGRRRAFTWYSPNGGNGFRLDQAFVSPAHPSALRHASHLWGGGRIGAQSDHSALRFEL